MKTILLGPNGQLGSDIRSENAKMGDVLSISPVDRSILDVADLNAVSRFLGGLEFDCLVNCTSYHKTDEVEGNAQLAFTINAHLVRRLAEICEGKKARFVHISTDYVFGGQNKRSPLAESDPKAPINVYGSSKALGEDLVLMSGVDALILRVASLFGIAGASGKGGNFVETMIRLGRTNGTLKVVADQMMSPTATADVARSLITMIKLGVPAGVWNVVNAGAATWCEFAERIIDRASVPAKVIPVTTSEFPTAAKRPPYSVLDNSKLASVTDPLRPWQDALDAYLVAKEYRSSHHH
jgi:dTDP-4-dehydrorhamnose reductase